MSNFKVGNSKFSRFVNGKGFYIALAICLVAIGTAAYIAVNSANGIIGNIKTGSGISSAKGATSSIPNWDSQNAAKQTGNTVSGVEDKRRSSKAAASSASSTAKQSSSSQAEKLVFAMPVAGSVITAYSADKPVYDKTMGDWRVHDGVDISANEGTPVKACAAGVVSEIRTDDMLGQEIIITHAGGLKSIYANLTSQVTVKKGQHVDVGDTLGAIGETAQGEVAVKPHLHFEMTRHGVDVDPLAVVSGQN